MMYNNIIFIHKCFILLHNLAISNRGTFFHLDEMFMVPKRIMIFFILLYLFKTNLLCQS